ncbi:hypothetical protein L1049_009693 [Liquidambar formosana]|uniref:Phosphofructokinase domain-containing protein n=1 Tax=Liquidambar formosana TaxID=63359 RepID=A0AAP0R6D0_LIQFO
MAAGGGLWRVEVAVDSDFWVQSCWRRSEVLVLISSCCHGLLNLEVKNAWLLMDGLNPMPALTSLTLEFIRLDDEDLNKKSRLDHCLPLPSVLKGAFKIGDGPPSSAAGNPDEIAKLFPHMFGQPSAMLVPGESGALGSGQKLKIGVVLSGGQAPGGHNVISGIFDYLQDRVKGSTLYGFRGGPAGIMKCKYVELNSDYIYPYRNQGGFDMICSGRDKIETPEQFKQAQETALKLDLDGLVVIGGDDSNTNACLLAENFRYEGRCGLPTNFDATYCYALGYGAAALLHYGKTGLISSMLYPFDKPLLSFLCLLAFNPVFFLSIVKIIIVLVSESTFMLGIWMLLLKNGLLVEPALTSMMDVERRHGKFKPVIKKAMVELEGAPFKKFASMRDEWALKNRYISPGPIQFIGPASNAVNHTLLLELGAQA